MRRRRDTPAGRRAGGTARRGGRVGGLLRRPLVLTALGVVLLLGVGVYVLGFTSVVPARDLEVSGVPADGAAGESAAAVEEAAALPVGGPLARVDTAGVHERVDTLVWVRDVSVSRAWTSGAVTVEVTPREPAAVLRDPEGRLEVVDAEGVAFREVDERPEGLPVFDVADPDPAVGEVSAAVATWESLPADLRDSVQRVDLAPDGLRYGLADGPTVVWGDAGQDEAKGRVVSTLLAQPEVEQAPDPEAVEIDVSVAGTPVLRGGAVIERED